MCIFHVEDLTIFCIQTIKIHNHAYTNYLREYVSSLHLTK